jgi:hypothetical protein
MLRRRGVPSVLYYGASHDAKSGLCAHVWVRDGAVDVVGGETASRYAVLATFPPNVTSRSQTLVVPEMDIDEIRSHL